MIVVSVTEQKTFGLRDLSGECIEAVLQLPILVDCLGRVGGLGAIFAFFSLGHSGGFPGRE